MIARLSEYSFFDLVRKSIAVLLRWIGYVRQFFRQIRLYFFTRCWINHIPGFVFVQGLCTKTEIGKNAALYPQTVLEIAENAKVSIGNNFTLSYGAIIASRHTLTIGNYVMIGEYSSIRDTTHAQDNCVIPYCLQNDQSEPVTIGNNVWIGKGCIVLPGSVIEDGVIVGANSIVKGRLKGDCMYAGAPAKLIKSLAKENVVHIHSNVFDPQSNLQRIE